MKALEGLSQQELSALRASIQTRSKDVRKTAIKAITAEPKLREAWSKYMAPKPADAPDDYSQKAREEFETALARCPDAFIKQMIANLHVEVDEGIRVMMLEMSKIRK